jgi:hypothetical protein
MIGLSESAVMETVLIGSLGTAVLGTLLSASVIFEADGYLDEHRLGVEEAQSVKRKRFMPRLRAPMYATFAGEIMLFVLTLFGAGSDLAMTVLGATTMLFLAFIVYLGSHFYKAGRRARGDADTSLRS